MGEWADGAFVRLQEQEGKDHAALQSAAEIRHQVRTEAPYLWKSVAKEIKQEISDFYKKRPDYLEIEDNSDYDDPPHIVLRSPAIKIQVFLDERPAINYEVYRRRPDREDKLDLEGTFRIGIHPTGPHGRGQIWLLDDQDRPRTPSDVKRLILNNLL